MMVDEYRVISGDGGAGARLGTTLAIAIALHLILLYGVRVTAPVLPGDGDPQASPIRVRLAGTETARVPLKPVEPARHGDLAPRLPEVLQSEKLESPKPDAPVAREPARDETQVRLSSEQEKSPPEPRPDPAPASSSADAPREPDLTDPPIPPDSGASRVDEVAPAPRPQSGPPAAPPQKPAQKGQGPAAGMRSPPSSPPSADADSPLPALGMSRVEDPTYYPAKQLDERPVVLHPVKPSYPSQAADAGIQGEVILLLLIDEKGNVRQATAVESKPPGLFEESAVEAFSKARFSPAKKDGRAVKSRVLIRVFYELN